MEFTTRDIDDWVQHTAYNLRELSASNNVDQIIAIPDSVGKGESYMTSFSDDNQLMLTDFDVCEDMVIEGDAVAMAGAFIVLEGELTLTFEGVDDISVSAGGACVFFINSGTCVMRYRKGHMKMLNFSMPLALVDSLIRQYQFDNNRENQLFVMPVVSSVGHIIEQIYQCQLTHVARRLYTQAKLMEVLTLLCDWYQQHRKKTSVVRPADLALIIKASQLIEQQMVSPPSLMALARQVGINDNKLKQYFKLVFGCTVFEYLDDKRLLRAELLLRSGHMNVKEVALDIGLKHQGNFSAKFKQRYQQSPSEYAKSHRA